MMGIETNIDLLRFRSVCKSWRSSLLPRITVSLRFPPTITVTTSSAKHLLRSNIIYRLELSELSETLSHSSFSKAWLIKVEESNYGRLCLLDPFTNWRLNIYSHSDTRYPPYSFTKVLNLFNVRFIEGMEAHSVSFNVYDGTRRHPQDGKVVVFPNFACTKVENRMFFSVHRDGKVGCSNIADMIRSSIMTAYLFIRVSSMLWIDGEPFSGLTLVQFSPPLCGLDKKIKKYKKHLAGSCGSLYVVDMYYEGDPNQDKGACYDVVDLKVCELEEEWGTWLDVKNLDEHAFVLGKDCNVSLPAREYHGPEENCIYFSNRDFHIQLSQGVSASPNSVRLVY